MVSRPPRRYKINSRMAETVVRLAKNLMHVHTEHWKHFTFIMKKNEVFSIGLNQPWKTHPMAEKYKYKFNNIHSELHAITKFDIAPSSLRKYTLINIRLNKNGKICMSKPCLTCQTLLRAFVFDEVWYTNEFQEFCKL